MYMKCLFTPLVSAIILVGLSACDEGRIPESHSVSEPAAAEDLTLMGAVQRQVFDARCIQCHGGSNIAAAGLRLVEGESRGQLLGRPSKLVEGALLVTPGNHEASVLYSVVASDVSTDWSFNHSSLLTDAEKYLLSTWIDLEN